MFDARVHTVTTGVYSFKLLDDGRSSAMVSSGNKSPFGNLFGEGKGNTKAVRDSDTLVT